MYTARAVTSSKPKSLLGEPLTKIRSPWMSRSSTFASSISAATLRISFLASRAASRTALPPKKVARSPQVPRPKAERSVSPSSTLIRSKEMPSVSAAIMAKVVRRPWPTSVSPGITRTLPPSSTLTMAVDPSKRGKKPRLPHTWVVPERPTPSFGARSLLVR